MTKPIRVMVTGGKGQLGQALSAEAAAFSQIILIVTDMPEVNICDQASLEAALQHYQPDVIINCAAYTAVDKAEAEPELAFRLNAEGVANLATLAKRRDIVLLQLSTDYVFSGQHYLPYTENDIPEPASVYGASKLAGEQAMLKTGVAGAVVRTSWLYSEFAANFVKTMLKLAQSRDSLQVVADQIGSPTYARDLAAALLNMALTWRSPLMATPQIWHYANSGVASWYDFAKAIFELSGELCQVEPVPTSAYPTAARRPAYSVLATAKFVNTFGVTIPYWRTSLARCLQRLK